MKKIANVEVMDDYKLKLDFEDGTSGVADVSHLVGKGVFALWNDYDEFRRVRIGFSGELMWSDQIDLCSDALYLEVTGKSPDEIFPGLRPEEARA